MRGLLASLLVLVAGGACTPVSGPDLDAFARDNFWGERVEGPELSVRISEAAKHPLGSWENPVRVYTVEGRRAYLSRLRCPDGSRPRFGRPTMSGAGIYGSLIEVNTADCVGRSRVHAIIYIDLDHPGRRETAAPAGFTLAREGAG